MSGNQNAGLTNLQNSVTRLEGDQVALLSLFKQLLANQQPGPTAGQVILNQSDIDAIQARVDALSIADETAEPASSAPPATPAAAKTDPAASKT